MRQRIRNTVTLKASEDMSGMTDITVYLKQQSLVLSYAGTASGEYVTFTIPKADALQLNEGGARIQVAYTDDGTPYATDAITVSIGELLWSLGYGS